MAYLITENGLPYLSHYILIKKIMLYIVKISFDFSKRHSFFDASNLSLFVLCFGLFINFAISKLFWYSGISVEINQYEGIEFLIVENR
mgnify:CR=1 FL=1